VSDTRYLRTMFNGVPAATASAEIGVAAGVLDVSVADGEFCPVITLSGEADSTTAAQLKDLITAQLSRGTRHLMVDVAELSSADPMAVRTLVLAALTLKDRGGGMVLRHPQRPVAGMLARIGAGRLITVDGEAEVIPEPEHEPARRREAGIGWPGW
jgi:anti-anti-sigma factor